MKCLVCHEGEGIYDYKLVDGLIIPVCRECGEILYGKNVGSEYHDHLFQMVCMINYVNSYKKFVAENREKVLTLKAS